MSATGLRWAGVCECECHGVNIGEIDRVSIAAQLAVGLPSVNIYWDPPQSRTQGNTVVPAAWLVLIALLFFLDPQ